MSITKTGILSCMAVLLALTGCTTTHSQNSSMERRATIEENRTYSPDKVSFADDLDVVFTEIRTLHEGSFYKIIFELMNAKIADTTHPVYQIEWLDKNGVPKQVTAWKPLLIKGNQKVKVTEMATVPGIVDYKITISRKEK